MTVLILSEDFDPTVDMVVDQLNSRGVPVLRIDTGWFPYRLSVDAELVDGRWIGALHTPHRHVALQDLRSVWYRRPTAFAFPPTMSLEQRRHCAYEAKFGLAGVLWSLPVRWVNHPARQADLYKPTQLATAASDCGLTVPDTLITNRPDRVRRFVDAHPSGVVIKPLGFNSITKQGQQLLLYTHLLTEEDLAELAGVEHTLHMFQAYIHKQHEVRLTVVGDRMFAAAIHAGSEGAQVDFRGDYPSLCFEVIDTPGSVAGGVTAFMHRFGLTYGAFDFAVDAAGVWWLLECNAGGQYAFVEKRTGLPISAAIADLLQKEPSS